MGHIRYISLDFTLYMEGGEATFKDSDEGFYRNKSSKRYPFSRYYHMTLVGLTISFIHYIR